MYQILVPRRVAKRLERLPVHVQDTFRSLGEDLKAAGPIQRGWPNFSSLGMEGAMRKYHCHLTYNYVACWKYEKGTIVIEVYYVGSRQSAPY